MAATAGIDQPGWINDPSRLNDGPMFFPVETTTDTEALRRRIELDPAPTFVKRVDPKVLDISQALRNEFLDNWDFSEGFFEGFFDFFDRVDPYRADLPGFFMR